jgi:two-component system, NarL family, invasion response regulator UvrY
VLLRVLHGDDSEAFRRLIELALPTDDIEVVGTAATPDDVVAEARRLQPDVVLIDQIGGAGLVARLREAAPSARVVVLSGYLPGTGDVELERAADGYAVKAADVEAWRAAVRGG